MSLCTLRAPASPGTQFRPIIAVKFNGHLESFATYTNKAYQFDVDPIVQEAINDGALQVEFTRRPNGEVTEINLYEPETRGLNDPAGKIRRNTSGLPPI